MPGYMLRAALSVCFFLSLNAGAQPLTFSAIAVVPQPLRCQNWVFGPGQAVAFDATRNLAFTGSGGAVQILNVATPATPVVSGEIVTAGLVEGLAYDPNTQILAVAAGKPGVELWNVATPGQPRRLARFALNYFGTRPPAHDVAVANGIAYIAADYGGLQYWDISNPSAPSQLGFFVPQGTTLGVSVAGNILYTAQGSNPAAAFTLNGAGIPTFFDNSPFSGGFGYDVFATQNLAYVAAGNGGLFVYDFFSFAAPVLIGQLATPNSARSVWLEGTQAYVADPFAGVRIIDVSNPANPVDLGSTSGSPRSLAADNALVFATGAPQFETVDVSTPTAPTVLGSHPFVGSAYGVWAKGPTAYVADSSAGLQIVKLNAFPKPKILGTVDTPGLALDVEVQGRYAYVADQTSGLRIIDVSAATNPVEVGFDTGVGYARNLAVSGNRVYVADLQAGIAIYDVNNPAAPTQLGTHSTGGGAADIAVAGTLAYVASGFFASPSGLYVVDVSNPSAPVTLGFLGTPGFASGVTVSGNLVLIADGPGGVRIIDVSNPASPAELGSWSNPSYYISSVSVQGNTAYGAAQGDGLVELDISTPASPTLNRFRETPGSSFNVFRSTSTSYVADGSAGVRVFGRCYP